MDVSNIVEPSAPYAGQSNMHLNVILICLPVEEELCWLVLHLVWL